MSAEESVKDMDKRITALEIYFKVALGVAAVFGLTGAVIFSQLTSAQAQIAELETRVTTIKPVVDASIEEIQKAGEAEVADLAVKTDRYLQASVERRFRELGRNRDGTVYDVTNPLMGALKAKCPPGTFVSGVSAPTGVGGKYAGDGISKISVVCSALVTPES